MNRRALCSAAVIAEKLYACAGEGGRAHITVERFGPAHETWELLRPTLHRRKDTTVAVLQDRLYVVGGMSDDDTALDSVESYDPETNSWEESVLVSRARSGAKVARVNGSLYVLGGAGESLRSAERFDPVTGRWEALPHMTVTGLWLVSAIRA